MKYHLKEPQSITNACFLCLYLQPEQSRLHLGSTPNICKCPNCSVLTEIPVLDCQNQVQKRLDSVISGKKFQVPIFLPLSWLTFAAQLQYPPHWQSSWGDDPALLPRFFSLYRPHLSQQAAAPQNCWLLDKHVPLSLYLMCKFPVFLCISVHACPTLPPVAMINRDPKSA